MGQRTHLFLAMSGFAFGEAVHGMALARALCHRGDRVLFLGPSSLQVLARDTPIKYGVLDAAMPRVDEAVRDVLVEQPCRSLVLVDAAQVYLGLSVVSREDVFLERIRPTVESVVALDVWNLPATSGQWDTGNRTFRIPRPALELPRLLPVPFVHPDASATTYNALGDIARYDRELARQRMHVGDDEKLVLFTTAGFQRPEAQDNGYHLHLAREVPPAVLRYVAKLGPKVKLLHIGPAPLPGSAELATYRYERQLPPDEFQAAVASCDLLLTLNVCATTIISMFRHGVPVLAIGNSRVVHPGQLPDHQRSLEPLLPFRIWPIGLAELVADALRDNPYTGAFDHVELLDEDAVLAACRRLLFDSTARDEAAQRRARYLSLVTRLPSAADAFARLVP